jgi:hypothetical protein
LEGLHSIQFKNTKDDTNTRRTFFNLKQALSLLHYVCEVGLDVDPSTVAQKAINDESLNQFFDEARITDEIVFFRQRKIICNANNMRDGCPCFKSSDSSKLLVHLEQYKKEPSTKEKLQIIDTKITTTFSARKESSSSSSSSSSSLSELNDGSAGEINESANESPR